MVHADLEEDSLVDPEEEHHKVTLPEKPAALKLAPCL